MHGKISERFTLLVVCPTKNILFLFATFLGCRLHAEICASGTDIDKNTSDETWPDSSTLTALVIQNLYGLVHQPRHNRDAENMNYSERVVCLHISCGPCHSDETS
jgi:hypothetical protein